MPILPRTIMTLLRAFEPLFTDRTWGYVPVLVAGSILAPRRRMVSSVLRAMGLRQIRWFQNYHRVLNRAVWSLRVASQILLGLLVATFAPRGPLVLGIDDTIERRRGKKGPEGTPALGVYRDPVRSSDSHFVKATGLRWVCLMLLVPIPWAQRVWALPFLTVLAPSERYNTTRGRRHKTVLDWSAQMVVQVRRWLPQRCLIVVADSHFAALEWLERCRRVARVTVITRLRLDAALYEPAPPRAPQAKGRPRLKGARLPTLAQVRDDPQTSWTSLTVSQWYGRGGRAVEIVSQTALWYHSGLPPVPVRWVLIRDPQGIFAPQALLCTDLTVTPQEILTWFVQRWQMEVTLEEARAHLGVETQRQWSDQAIARTTPALLGLFSMVTLLADRLLGTAPCPTRQSAWYVKAQPTFADTLALVRQHLWTHTTFALSPSSGEEQKVPRALVDHLADLLCYAA